MDLIIQESNAREISGYSCSASTESNQPKMSKWKGAPRRSVGVGVESKRPMIDKMGNEPCKKKKRSNIH